MRILVRHPDADADGRLASHAEKLLRRVLDRYCLSIDLVQVRINTSADAEGGRNSKCRLTVKLLSNGSVRAEASDREAVLALYRAADRVAFLLWQRFQSANAGTTANA
jgi:hypothetical protein